MVLLNTIQPGYRPQQMTDCGCKNNKYKTESDQPDRVPDLLHANAVDYVKEQSEAEQEENYLKDLNIS
jgi:hypothetical protein